MGMFEWFNFLGKCRRVFLQWRYIFLYIFTGFNCPGEEAALVIIVVSLPYTAYHWGSLIVLWSYVCSLHFIHITRIHF